MHIWTANLMSLSLCYFPHQYHSHFTILNIIIKMIYYQVIMGILCICFALFAGSRYQSSYYHEKNLKWPNSFLFNKKKTWKKILSCQVYYCISSSGVITSVISKSSTHINGSFNLKAPLVCWEDFCFILKFSKIHPVY